VPARGSEIRTTSSIEEQVSALTASIISPLTPTEVTGASESDEALIEISDVGVNIRMSRDVDPMLLTKLLRALKEA